MELCSVEFRGEALAACDTNRRLARHDLQVWVKPPALPLAGHLAARKKKTARRVTACGLKKSYRIFGIRPGERDGDGSQPHPNQRRQTCTARPSSAREYSES